MIYIFDIDGTLADISHRLHFIQQKPADWTGFFRACPADKPIKEVVEIYKVLQNEHSIKIITGRSSEILDETAQWLGDNGMFFSDLLMRESGDHREDYIVKAELFDNLIRTHYWNQVPVELIAGIFEDRKQVVKMYRAKGLRVFQVAEGNF